MIGNRYFGDDTIIFRNIMLSNKTVKSFCNVSGHSKKVYQRDVAFNHFIVIQQMEKNTYINNATLGTYYTSGG